MAFFGPSWFGVITGELVGSTATPDNALALGVFNVATSAVIVPPVPTPS